MSNTNINIDEKYYKNIREGEFLDVNMSGGADNYREGADIVERNNVAVIIKHPTEEKFLISKWKKVNWNGFLTGGIEEGDSKEDTAKIEIKEETGFVNIRSATALDFASHGIFYHVVKNQNRMAHYNLVIAELEDMENVGVSEEELEICDFVWVDKADVREFLTRDDIKSLWDFYNK